MQPDVVGEGEKKEEAMACGGTPERKDDGMRVLFRHSRRELAVQ